MQQVDRFLTSPAHGLVISGQAYTHKADIAHYIIASLLGVANTASHPYILLISPAPSSIGIEAVREIQQFIKLVVPGSNALRRAILINEAETISTEAQNALLKMLEEPPADTIFVLCTGNPRQLLPTILSRVQTIQSTPLSLEQAVQTFASTHEQAAIEKAFFMSEGAPRLLQTLLDNPDDTSLQTINEAKLLLSKSSFEKMLRVEELSKNKEALQSLLAALLRVINAAMIHAAKQQNDQKVTQWLQKQKLVLRSIQQLEQGTNSKLVATSVMLAL